MALECKFSFEDAKSIWEWVVEQKKYAETQICTGLSKNELVEF